jgi:hypothetical protein
MYTVAVLQILRNQVPRRAMVYFVEQDGNQAMPLRSIHSHGYEIVGTFEQGGEIHLILES